MAGTQASISEIGARVKVIIAAAVIGAIAGGTLYIFWWTGWQSDLFWRALDALVFGHLAEKYRHELLTAAGAGGVVFSSFVLAFYARRFF